MTSKPLKPLSKITEEVKDNPTDLKRLEEITAQAKLDIFDTLNKNSDAVDVEKDRGSLEMLI